MKNPINRALVAKKKLLLFTTMCLMALSMSAQDYVDLGLPSGTLWSPMNEELLQPYPEAKARFGDRIPTWEQWHELINYCQWTWTGKGYKLIGPNGNSIYLPAAGVIFPGDGPLYVGESGDYWSSTEDPAGNMFALTFDEYRYLVRGDMRPGYGFSVRLVKNK